MGETIAEKHQAESPNSNQSATSQSCNHQAPSKGTLDNRQVDWLIREVSEKIGIFEAKTKLSELCSKVAETGEEYVITRRGRPVARIVAPAPAVRGEPTGVLERMRKTEREFGAIPRDEPEFPDVWEERRGCTPSPLDAKDQEVAPILE